LNPRSTGLPIPHQPDPSQSRQRRIDEAVAESRRLSAQREADTADAVGAGAARGLERATDLRWR
jgi:hypothetical protein